jgi:AcrR family transcriptional regulator
MTMTSTRRRILDTALACFLEYGYEQTTVARIRQRSATSNGALFHHFASKEAIADALYVEAIASFQEGLWELLRRKPRTLRAAVRGTIAHQLRWAEEHADLARFVYPRGHLDWDSPAGADLEALNRELAAAFRRWMAPLADRGEIRPTSMLMISAIVSGPTHAIARRWLSGQLASPLTGFVDELTDAACAGLGGRPAPTRPSSASPPSSPLPPPPASPAGHLRDRHRPHLPALGRVTLELVSDDGSVVAHGEVIAQLVPGVGDSHPPSS